MGVKNEEEDGGEAIVEGTASSSWRQLQIHMSNELALMSFLDAG